MRVQSVHWSLWTLLSWWGLTFSTVTLLSWWGLTFSTVDVLNKEVVKGNGRLNGAQDLTMTTCQQQDIREQQHPDLAEERGGYELGNVPQFSSLTIVHIVYTNVVVACVSTRLIQTVVLTFRLRFFSTRVASPSCRSSRPGTTT